MPRPPPTHFLLKGIDFKGNSNDDTKIGLAPNDNKIIDYFRLQREANTWRGKNQVKLARECERRANALLNGNMNEYNRQVHSEELFNYTKKFKQRTNFH